MYATNYYESAIINLARGQNITAPENVYLALYQSNPGEAGGGTEIAYTGYTRMPITFTAPASSGANALEMSNNAQISFAEAPASAGTVTHVAILDALSGGTMWLYGALTEALSVEKGVTPVIRQGAVKWIFSGNLSTTYRTSAMNVLRGTSASGFTPYIGLCSGDPQGSGNEFSGYNYARIAVTMTAPAEQASGVMQSENSADVLSNISTGNWGTLSYIGVYDAASNGNIYMSAALSTTYSMITGTAAGFHAGDLRINMN